MRCCFAPALHMTCFNWAIETTDGNVCAVVAIPLSRDDPSVSHPRQGTRTAARWSSHRVGTVGAIRCNVALHVAPPLAATTVLGPPARHELSILRRVTVPAPRLAAVHYTNASGHYERGEVSGRVSASSSQQIRLCRSNTVRSHGHVASSCSNLDPLG